MATMHTARLKRGEKQEMIDTPVVPARSVSAACPSTKPLQLPAAMNSANVLMGCHLVNGVLHIRTRSNVSQKQRAAAATDLRGGMSAIALSVAGTRPLKRMSDTVSDIRYIGYPSWYPSFRHYHPQTFKGALRVNFDADSEFKALRAPKGYPDADPDSMTRTTMIVLHAHRPAAPRRPGPHLRGSLARSLPPAAVDRGSRGLFARRDKPCDKLYRKR